MKNVWYLSTQVLKINIKINVKIKYKNNVKIKLIGFCGHDSGHDSFNWNCFVLWGIYLTDDFSTEEEKKERDKEKMSRQNYDVQ